MKQIAHITKKDYVQPEIEIIERESVYILAGSPTPPNYDDELDAKKNWHLFNDDEQDW